MFLIEEKTMQGFKNKVHHQKYHALNNTTVSMLSAHQEFKLRLEGIKSFFSDRIYV